MERHPWNTGFAWTTSPGGGAVLTDEQIAQFDREGYCVLRDAIGPAVIAEVRDEGDRFEAESEAFMRSLPGERAFIGEAGAISFTVHVAARSLSMKSLTMHPVLQGVVRDLIGDDVRLYWDQLVYKRPEKPRRFPWHQDNSYAFVDIQRYLTVWTPLTTATIDNGCPWIAPRRHLYGSIRHRFVDPLGWECLTGDGDAEGAVAAEVEPGDLVLFSSLTPHMTGPNVTADTRKAYIMQYVANGAAVLHGNPADGPPTHSVPCDAPDRQYPIVGCLG